MLVPELAARKLPRFLDKVAAVTLPHQSQARPKALPKGCLGAVTRLRNNHSRPEPWPV